MVRHNLLIIFRSLKRFRQTFIINLLGLSTGLASVLLIYLWVNDELAVDKFHEKDEVLYQIFTNVQENNGELKTLIDTPGPLAQLLAEEFSEIEYAACVAPSEWRGFDSFILTVDDKTIRATGEYASKEYFNIFSYVLTYGDASQVLVDKNSIAISEGLASKIFNSTEEAVGKIVQINQEREFVVSGIFKNLPSTSSRQFDFVLPFDAYLDVAPWYTNWNNWGPHTFVVLHKGTSPEDFNARIENLFQEKLGGDENSPTLHAVRYSDYYLHGTFENGVSSGGRIEYVRLFSVIGLFILVIACINFMNLSTARASIRVKEIGVKKALGAGRKRIAAQFFGESMVMTLLSFVVAAILVKIAIPQFNLITGKVLEFNFSSQMILVVAGIMVFTGLLAGSYPAIFLSGFNPIRVLKGRVKSSAGEIWIRKGLVTFQFTLSIILIASVFVVYKQIEFIQNTNPGYNKENIIYFDVEGRAKENTETFLTALKQTPGVVSAASSTSDMTGHSWTVGFSWEGKVTEDRATAELMAVNQDFLEVLGLEIIQGRFFSRDFGNDTTRVVINETAARLMGFENPIGKKIQDREVIGVIKDFHLESFHEIVKPQLFVLHRKYFAPASLVMVRIESGKEKAVLERLNAFYKNYNPGFPFDYNFLDEDYQNLYISEHRVSTLSKYFAGLAILISCLGLFGLATFTAQRRMKEIGIRKILGSGDFGIVRLLTGEFTTIVLISIFIAIPLSVIITSNWLTGFAYRIDLQWWFFVISGFLSLLIAWLTVGIQTYRVARVNPTECLKDE